MLEAAWEMLPRLLEGLGRTVLLLFACVALSLPLALGFALAQLSRSPALQYLSSAYVFVFRGVPALVQLFFVYYGFSMSETLRDSWAWYFFESAWFCGIFALTLNSGAYQTEIFRGALQAVSRDLLDAARSLGLSRAQVFWLIHVPEAFRLALPAYGNELVLLAKASSIVSTITILDLLGTAKLIYTETFDPFTPLLAAAVLYLLLVLAIQGAVSGIEWWLMPERRGQRSEQGIAAAVQAH
jgi:His/Glu/Gln/Arg/opine family amino acid ABC transporter permease subunit